MRKGLIMVVVSFLAVGPAAVLAQQGQMGGPGPGGQEGMQKQFAPKQFPEVKAQRLKMIDERRARLDQERACAEKTANREELQKCGQMHRGPGQQHPPQTGGEGAK
jgi:hypothetical protein